MLTDVKRGKAAELIFTAKALLNGLDVYQTVTDDGRIDLIVNGHRVQVKIVSHSPAMYVYGYIRVVKRGKTASGETKSYKYTKTDVDFIVGVNLETFDIYIVPIEYAEKYSNNIVVSKTVQEGYINNFDILK